VSGDKSLTYKFRRANGEEKEFTIKLDATSLRLEVPARADYPEWTKLEFHKCPNCPLDPAKDPRCPAAVSLVDVIEFFKECLSTEVADITIYSEQREFHAKKSLQTTLSSLMGLHMATSGCPVLGQLRPMAYIHIPFCTLKETMFRAISMYLLAQFLRRRSGKPVDWDLNDLRKLYEGVNEVNRAFSKRLMSINPADASLNAVANLDCFASFTSHSIEKNMLDEFEKLFESYLKD
jgi:hypothetical protein